MTSPDPADPFARNPAVEPWPDDVWQVEPGHTIRVYQFSQFSDATRRVEHVLAREVCCTLRPGVTSTSRERNPLSDYGSLWNERGTLIESGPTPPLLRVWIAPGTPPKTTWPGSPNGSPAPEAKPPEPPQPAGVTGLAGAIESLKEVRERLVALDLEALSELPTRDVRAETLRADNAERALHRAKAQAEALEAERDGYRHEARRLRQAAELAQEALGAAQRVVAELRQRVARLQNEARTRQTPPPAAGLDPKLVKRLLLFVHPDRHMNQAAAIQAEAHELTVILNQLRG